MSRRISTGLLILLLLAALLGGCVAVPDAQEPLALYYRRAEVAYTENGLIDSENADRDLERSPAALADRYFAGPDNETLVSPFPKGTALVSCTQEDGVLALDLTENFAELSGVDLSLALTCISLTFSQLDDVELVEVSVGDNLMDGQEQIRLSQEQVLLADNSLEIAENMLNVYYADEQYRYLIAAEEKTKLETVEEQAAYAISMLGAEPESETQHATLPAGTEILDLSIEDGLCIVDFSVDFYRNRPSSEAEERLTILSVVDTLTEFEEIESVQFYVEGEVLTTYYRMDLSMKFVRDETAIGPVRAGLNEVDATLSVLRKNDWALTEIPMRIKSAANETDSDAVLSALLSFGERNGYLSPIPAGTKVLSLTERSNHCYVDLSRDFADGLTTEKSELLAVQSIVSSLTSLETVRYVTITIEGKPSGLDYVDLNQEFE